ncbi:MAG: sigma-70 family RNA polymerase sigma factor, partial [Ilumatobacteraceae bacterium]
MNTTMTNEEPITFTAEEMDEHLGIYRPGSARPAPEWVAPESYPRMFNLSAGFIYGDVMVRAEEPTPAEYVTIPMRGPLVELQVMLAKWNILWESAQFRRRAFDCDKLPPVMAKVAELGDNNVVFVPRTRSRYLEYAPLYHLLPQTTVERFGLPLLRAGQWPFVSDYHSRSDDMPSDFAARLQNAWASHIWRHLMPGSPASGFTKDDPIRLLAHNLDFWLPPVTEVVQDILRSFPAVGDEIEPEPVLLEDGTVLEGAVRASTRVGSDLWAGEIDAGEVTAWTIEQADTGGRLRGILDAVRRNRIEDDFSERWSFAREDFERKLYRKRSKVKVTFVELTDTIPVQSPEADVVGHTVTADFMAVLNERDRQVVVLLNSGHTSLTEIADVMGYAN